MCKPILRLALAIWGMIAVFSGAAHAIEPQCADIKAINLPSVFFRHVASDSGSSASWAYETPEGKKVTDAQLLAVRKQGFNAVRVIINAAPLLAGKDNENSLKAIEEFSATASRDGLCAIYSLALPTWNAKFTDDAVLRDKATLELYAGALAALAQAATKSGGRSALIETENEPAGHCNDAGGEWPEAQVALYQRVRDAARDATIIVSGACWSSVDGLLKLDVSPYRGDAHVLFAVHFYEPHAFAEQGVHKQCPFPELRNVQYPAGPDCVTRAEPSTLAAVGAAAGDAKCVQSAKFVVENYCRSEGSRAFLKARIGRVADWASAHQIALRRIFFGEFGVVRRAPDGAGGEEGDRVRWIADMHALLTQRQFGWALWGLDAGFAVQCEGASLESGVCSDVLQAVGLQDK